VSEVLKLTTTRITQVDQVLLNVIITHSDRSRQNTSKTAMNKAGGNCNIALSTKTIEQATSKQKQ
jgi:hypothetical protein